MTARERVGLFLVLEGIDGSGKSTQLARLASWLRGLDLSVVETREPTTGSYGARYRDWARGEFEASAAQVVELFVLDRREHVRELIAPALASRAIVLCDRYVASTLAYQVAQGFPRDELERRLAREDLPEPDLTLWLRLPVARAMERLGGARREVQERYEHREFLERVDAEYARLDLEIVDADATEREVELALRQRIAPLLDELFSLQVDDSEPAP